MIGEKTCLLNLGECIALLQQTPGFSALSLPLVSEVAGKMKEVHFLTGEIIAREAEKGRKLFIVAEGKAEMSVEKTSDAVPIALLTKGEFFGASSLLDTNNFHTGTVTALTKLRCFTLDDADFDLLTLNQPRFKAAMVQFEQDLTEAKFIKLATPFGNLSAEQTENLARSIELISCMKGQALYTLGDKEDSCYLIFSGKMEIILPALEQRSEKRLGMLGRGALLGETALLTVDSMRRETAIAVEDCQLLVLQRSELMKTMREDVRTFAQISQLLQMSARPRQVKEVQIFERKTATGNPISILKNPATFSYFRLSPEGLFIWNQLDGNSSIRDITLSFYKEYRRFAPAVIKEIMTGLAASEFLKTTELDRDVEECATAHITRKQRSMMLAMRLLDWKITFNNVDGYLEKIYRKFIWVAFTRAAQVFFALISLCGLALLLLHSDAIYRTMHSTNARDLLLVIPLTLIAIVLHEAGHAFTVKAKGYQVPHVGFGWYWYGPFAFIDTSDTWLATKRERVAVSFAGPYMNLITGGVAVILAAIFPGTLLASSCMLFAFISYAIFLFNFNPLLEYDGYYILIDWMDYPNLRSHSLKWLRQNWRTFLKKATFIKNRAEALYTMGTVGYSIFMSISIFFFYRDYFQEFVTRLLSPAMAEGIGWFLGIAVLLVSFMGIISQAKK